MRHKTKDRPVKCKHNKFGDCILHRVDDTTYSIPMAMVWCIAKDAVICRPFAEFDLEGIK